jgi:hypothetical protein
MLAELSFRGAEECAFALLLIQRIAAEFVRENPWDVGSGRRVDELGLGVWGCEDAHGDYKGVLAFESGDQSRGVGIVDLFDHHAGGEGGGAVGAGYGCHGVLAGFEQGFDDEFSDVAASLENVSDESGVCFE